MAPSSRIPPLLQPHTRLPKHDSLFLITSTLGASANWLIIRFLCEALGRDSWTKAADDGGDAYEDMAVVLVSWTRDWAFWRSEARKSGGLDLERLGQEKKLAFVDGLSQMHLPDISPEKAPHSQTHANRTTGPATGMGRLPQTMLSARGPPGRMDPRAPLTTVTTAPVPSTRPTNSLSKVDAPAPGHIFVASSGLQEVQHTIESAIRHVKSTNAQSKCLLILDTPSFLLAGNPTITPAALSATVLHLHTLASHVLVHVGADDALISLSTPPQPLEADAHNFLVKTAHMSSRILSCRVLDTGFAKDVSGVLRITENSIGLDMSLQRGEGDAEEHQGKELLYLVKGDGSVNMFERGAGENI